MYITWTTAFTAKKRAQWKGKHKQTWGWGQGRGGRESKQMRTGPRGTVESKSVPSTGMLNMKFRQMMFFPLVTVVRAHLHYVFIAVDGGLMRTVLGTLVLTGVHTCSFRFFRLSVRSHCHSYRKWRIENGSCSLVHGTNWSCWCCSLEFCIDFLCFLFGQCVHLILQLFHTQKINSQWPAPFCSYRKVTLSRKLHLPDDAKIKETLRLKHMLHMSSGFSFL